MKFQTELCRCIKCDLILVDHNPQVDAEKYMVDTGTPELERIEVDGEFFWACPTCKDDGHLIDM